MKLKNKKAAIILAIVIIVIGLLSIFIITRKTENKDLASPDIYIEKQVKNENRNGKTTYVDDVIAINKKYQDAKAWINISGTNIDYPVFQTTDNERYIKADRDNNKYKWGEIFLDYRSSLEDLKSNGSKNIIIYGHNTTRDNYFTPLLKYRDREFFNKNKIITLSTKEKDYKFEIFSAYETDTSFYYIDTKFNDIYEYSQFLYSLEAKSVHKGNKVVVGNETIITLSTCVEGKDNSRFVIHGILI